MRAMLVLHVMSSRDHVGADKGEIDDDGNDDDE